MLHVEQAALLQLVQRLVLPEQLVLKLNLQLQLQVALKLLLLLLLLPLLLLLLPLLLLQQAELAVQQLCLVRTQVQTPVSKWERRQSWGQVSIPGVPLLADLMQLLQLVPHRLPWQLPQDPKQAHLQVPRMLQALMGMLQAPPGMHQALVLQESLVCQHVGMMPAQGLLAPLCKNLIWVFLAVILKAKR